MANIGLFAETGIVAVPYNVGEWLSSYIQQGHQLIVGDTTGGDSKFHEAISRIGGNDHTTIYCMDSVKNNAFSFKTKIFKTSFDEEQKAITIYCDDNSIEPQTFGGVNSVGDITWNSNWYQFRDKQIVKDSDMIIIVTVSNTLPKRLQQIVQYASMTNTKVHIVSLGSK